MTIVPCSISLRMLLEVMGYPAATFESASEVLRSDMREVECLILDHHLPNITGLELAKRLRADGSDMRISADHRLTLSGNIRSGR